MAWYQRIASLAIFLILAGCETNVPVSDVPTATDTLYAKTYTYRTVDKTELKAYVFLPKERPQEPGPVIVLFHGGGWQEGKAAWVFRYAQLFAEQGIVAMSMDYRLSVFLTTPVDSLDDTCEAFKWVRANATDFGVDPTKVAAYGESAGGQLAAASATVGCGSTDGRFGSGGPDALLLLSPVVDAASNFLFRQLVKEDARKYSPIDQVRRPIAPTFIAEGDQDTITPLGPAQEFCQKIVAYNGRCELQVYPGLGHVLVTDLNNQLRPTNRDPVATRDSAIREVAFLGEIWKGPGERP